MSKVCSKVYIKRSCSGIWEHMWRIACDGSDFKNVGIIGKMDVFESILQDIWAFTFIVRYISALTLQAWNKPSITTPSSVYGSKRWMKI